MDKMNFKKCKSSNNGITLIALVITIIVLLILAGITINALTGSDSAPAKANEAEQKNDIGSAKDQIGITATNAKLSAYDTAYVGNGVSSKEAATTVGQAVIDAVLQYNGKTIGKALIEVEQLADRNAEITITTRDFKEYGLIELSDGTLKWIKPVPITTIGTITASNSEVEETKTITLTAPINDDATERLTWTSSDDTVATVTSTGKNTAVVTGLEGQVGKSVTITASYKDLTPVTIEISVVMESFVGKYADINGDGTPDGIIFADFLAQKPTEKWVNNDGRYTLPTITDVDKVKTYEIIGNTTDARFEKAGIASTSYTSRDVVKLSSTSTGTEKRFYVMQITEYNNGTRYKWDDAKDLTDSTTTTDGALTYNWTCPTKEQWAMFGSAFSISSISTDPHYYENYGLRDGYWSSEDSASHMAWFAGYANGYMLVNYKTKTISVRLCTTF